MRIVAPIRQEELREFCFTSVNAIKSRVSACYLEPHSSNDRDYSPIPYKKAARPRKKDPTTPAAGTVYISAGLDVAAAEADETAELAAAVPDDAAALAAELALDSAEEAIELAADKAEETRLPVTVAALDSAELTTERADDSAEPALDCFAVSSDSVKRLERVVTHSPC